MRIVSALTAAIARSMASLGRPEFLLHESSELPKSGRGDAGLVIERAMQSQTMEHRAELLCRSRNQAYRASQVAVPPQDASPQARYKTSLEHSSSTRDLRYAK